jgi:hypothetical protein
MRATGLVAFAVLGVFLVLTPLISDHLRTATAARLLEHRPDLKEVKLGPGMAEEYRWACWIIGGIMILIAAMFGAQEKQVTRKPPKDAGPSSSKPAQGITSAD